KIDFFKMLLRFFKTVDNECYTSRFLYLFDLRFLQRGHNPAWFFYFDTYKLSVDTSNDVWHTRTLISRTVYFQIPCTYAVQVSFYPVFDCFFGYRHLQSPLNPRIMAVSRLFIDPHCRAGHFLFAVAFAIVFSYPLNPFTKISPPTLYGTTA